MKKTLFLLIMLTAGVTANAQQYTVRKDAKGHTIQLSNDSTLLYSAEQKNLPMFRAGKYLKESASFDMISCSFTVMSAVAYSGAVTDKRAVCNTLGTVLAIGALATRIVSVSYKSKAGTELELSAGRIVWKF